MSNNPAERAQRLKSFVKYLKIKQKAFAEKVGTKDVFISQIINGHNSLTREMAHRIGIAYPKLNKEWLLEGDGEMILEAEQAQESPPYYVPDKGAPSMEDVERLRVDVVTRYKPIPPLTAKQNITLLQACYKTIADNPGAVWEGLVIGAGVYLRFIQDYDDFVIPGHGLPGGV